MNEAPVNPTGLAGKNLPDEMCSAGPKPHAGWSRSRWLTLFALIFAVHVACIFLFGQQQPIAPRTVKNAPTLKLAAEGADEWLALNDPTLFALPHPQDFATANWLTLPGVQSPSFRWDEPPRWLPLAADGLGAALSQFSQLRLSHPLDFKPVAPLNASMPSLKPQLPQASVMQMDGELARRQLSPGISLTNWPHANVIAPSRVQVLVDTAGNVISTVLLPPGSGYTSADQYEIADDRALELARSLHFKPGSQLTVGQITFRWHTVPPPATP